MCTSWTLQTKNGQHLFARTMDFTLDFNQEVLIIPRRYQWNNITGEIIKVKHFLFWQLHHRYIGF
jgi:choloylglycine hydrolase